MTDRLDPAITRAIDSLTRRLLGRPASNDEIQTFGTRWADGNGAGDVVDQLLSSSERRRLLNRRALMSTGLRLGICHIPKCAGTSVAVAIQDLGLANPSLGYNEVGTVQQAGSSAVRPKGEDATSLRNSLTQYPVVIGHFDLATLVEADCNEIAVLIREPRSRIISLFRFWESLPANELDAWGEGGRVIREAISGGLSAFLTNQSIERDLNNAISAQLLRSAFGDESWAAAFDEQWHHAKARITHAYWHFESDDLLGGLSGLIPEENPAGQPRRNVTPRETGDPMTLSLKDLRRLDQLTRLDMRVLRDLMNEGKLSSRSQDSLDNEFASTLRNHRIELS